jgi:Na+-driven multidrug efflux pump
MRHAHLVTILTIASLIDTSQCRRFSAAGMAKHRRLAIFSIGSGLVNLGLSLALVRPLGVTGVALGTLIPTALSASSSSCHIPCESSISVDDG